ncbi:UDP-N-acetylmuramoyl-L-alanine--D-glutamate ligase [Larsenimonas rhizosphaerae]|uniref:UDP-N-acetylmuramoyl-L-alanine--D-glutamate ligase n=1 Tax=Larsenimonas rhizosphaerae TaxID=2944682 RepID=UPI002AFE491C|nr:UDP-N-acetylmuramoyl-L-alanine--D-glutamate ligase [Larsenimonas rhizosphaerae]
MINQVPDGVTLVVGLGVSGMAIARHLACEDVPFMMADTRVAPPGLAAFQAEFPAVAVYTGELSALDMRLAREVVISPGVSPLTPGLPSRVVGELALFARRRQRFPASRLVAITGSNAKSTVTTLVGAMAQAQGIKAAVGGNLGLAALELPEDADVYILELSSFQLETTEPLHADVACYLNLSEDHLDRHGDLSGYGRAKQRVFEGAHLAIANRQDPLTHPVVPSMPTAFFTRKAPRSPDEWGLADRDGERWLMHGEIPLIKAADVVMQGEHNLTNALAALAIGEAMGWSMASMCRVLASFKGLPHRMELITHHKGVAWINDSKGTNVGATLAAIDGLRAECDGQLILLAGGIGKGADFSPLARALRGCGQAIVYGRDRALLEVALAPHVAVQCVDTLAEACQAAVACSRSGDVVLLSPACASLDQFENFEARGEAFRQYVTQQEQAHEVE